MGRTTVGSDGKARAERSAERARRAGWGPFAVAALALAGLLAVGGCGRRSGPDPKLLTVIDKSFQPLRREFEAARNKVRLVAIVAPVCGRCQEAAKAIHESVLPEIDSKDFEVILVWVSHVPPDVEVRARVLAERLRDPRIKHYWDDSGRIARAFGVQAGLPPGTDIYDVYYLYERGDTWDPEGAMAGEPPDWNALMEGWMPAPPRVRWGGYTDVRMPPFDAAQVRDRVREALGQTRP